MITGLQYIPTKSPGHPAMRRLKARLSCLNLTPSLAKHQVTKILTGALQSALMQGSRIGTLESLARPPTGLR